ncbi:MAG: class I SAM-dependent rRNA methyltransferase [Solobacterium sp.]|nr:class I SAM-dependent rRNA methyltransferase [Solobacterium sp.]
MKQNRTFPEATVTKKQENRLKNGHPWVYEDEILNDISDIPNGSLIDVFGMKHNYLGTGLYSAASKIKVRILMQNANESFDDAYFARKVRHAVDYRREVMGGNFSACRLIHGESDGLPGVTADRYGDVIVCEIASYGMEIRKKALYHALMEIFEEIGEPLAGIYERNESDLRLKEGLPQYKGWALGETSSNIIHIRENGLLFEVDIENGQKTGFFLDQKYNRLCVRKIAHGKKVLDCCTHTGSFALNAAAGGALSTEAVDISETALQTARRNAELNGLEDKIVFTQADVFELLEKKIAAKEKYDLIILDPPAFTKSRKTVRNAKSGYQAINTMAARLLKKGGYLATCSCSHFMTTEYFRDMLNDSAKEAGVHFRIVEERHASMDHPVMIGIPETDYLKFFLLQAV